MILEPLHFGAFLLSKNKIKKCTKIQPATHRLNFVHLHPSVQCSNNFLMINQIFFWHLFSRREWVIWFIMISDPFVTNNFLMINQTFCLTSVQQRGMCDMIYYDFRSFCYQQLPNDQPNTLFDICSLHCAAKGVLSSCPKSWGRNKCKEGWGIWIQNLLLPTTSKWSTKHFVWHLFTSLCSKGGSKFMS